MTGRLGVYLIVSEGSATWLGKSIAHSLTCLVCEASFHDRKPKTAACAAQVVAGPGPCQTEGQQL